MLQHSLIEQTIDQTLNQSRISHSIRRVNDELYGDSDEQSVTQYNDTISRTIKHSVDLSTDGSMDFSRSNNDQSNNQTISQSNKQSIHHIRTRSTDRSINQSNDQAFNQSVNQPKMSINAEFGIASVDSSFTRPTSQSVDQSKPSYLRSQSLNVPSFRPRSASDLINQSNNQSSTQSGNQSNNQINYRKTNLRSQSLSSLQTDQSNLSADQSFKQVSNHVSVNYKKLVRQRRNFLIVCSILSVVCLIAGLSALWVYLVDGSVDHVMFGLFGGSLLWLLIAQSSGLVNQRLYAADVYLASINQWFRLFGIQYDLSGNQLQVMSMKSLHKMARKEHKRSLSNNQSVTLPTSQSIKRASSEEMRQRVIAELEDEEQVQGVDQANKPPINQLVLTPSDYPKIQPPHRHKGEVT